MAKDKKASKYASMRGAVQAGKDQLEKKQRGGVLNIGDKKYWKPKKGTNFIDILPYEVSINNHPAGIEPGQLFQQLKFKVHYGVGSEDKTVLCPTTFGKKCPICERRIELFKDVNADEEELKELKAKDRVVFNIIDLDDEEAGVQIFEFSPHLFANMLYEEIEAADGEYDDVFSLDAGFTIKVRFSSKKIGKNEFLEATRIDFEERDPYDDSIIDDCLDLDTIANVMEYKDLELLFLDEEPEAKPEPTKQRPRREPEEEERPSRSRRDKKEEPEEEEEKPERSSRRKPKDEPEEEPEPKTSRRSRKEPEPEPKDEQDNEPENKSGCPHGFVFGADCEREDACDECTEWEACRDEKDRLDAEKKPGRSRK